MLGLAFDAITITSNGNKKDAIPFKKRKFIVFTSRVHAGENNASYMVEGIIAFLLSDSKQAEILRSTFIFKLVPMLNPDGVVLGN